MISTLHELFHTTGTYHITEPFGKAVTGALYMSLGDLFVSSALLNEITSQTCGKLTIHVMNADTEHPSQNCTDVSQGEERQENV